MGHIVQLTTFIKCLSTAVIPMPISAFTKSQGELNISIWSYRHLSFFTIGKPWRVESSFVNYHVHCQDLRDSLQGWCSEQKIPWLHPDWLTACYEQSHFAIWGNVDLVWIHVDLKNRKRVKMKIHLKTRKFVLWVWGDTFMYIFVSRTK